ncbi:hypothetical protein TNCV_4191781 [Trichonephila clavipes]|nr:hypothetical protein TNCV_4191781 [Trichonephila clavipes]
MEAQLRNEESVPLIQGIQNNANDDASDQEKAHPCNLFLRSGCLFRGLGHSYRPHGWDIGAKHTHLAVRPVECELAQGGVEHRGHLVGLGKWSPVQLKG